jgi:hypothetical protein
MPDPPPDEVLDEESAYIDSSSLVSTAGTWLNQQESSAYSEVGLHPRNRRSWLTLTRHRTATVETPNMKGRPTDRKHHRTLPPPSFTPHTAPSTSTTLQVLPRLPRLSQIWTYGPVK